MVSCSMIRLPGAEDDMVRRETATVPMMTSRFTLLAILALGASWARGAGEDHWAFRPVADPELPAVANPEWIRQPLDHFTLAAREQNQRPPVPAADQRTLIRRAYFDLIGLPPTPDQVHAFLADRSPDAYAKVVDGLLASHHFGERWGRHWLDLARYGDSNGGDENHPYPLAWRYRNWVIDAINRDLPYDQFVREQLAGDLMNPASADRIAATGFLAIGTKIIAEKDLVKKRADIVDEQIDTVGRVFLALSLGCARCHDHKFDPVPERDYYALAGIFHSTAIENRELPTPEAIATRKKRAKQIETLNELIATANQELERFVDRKATIEWEAEDHARGNVIVDWERYGDGIGIISDPGGQKNFAEYDVEIEKAGSYFLYLRYAAAKARPGRALIDGVVAVENAIAEATGGWMPENQQWHYEGQLELTVGKRVLRLESEPMMSHLDKIRLVPVSSPLKARQAHKTGTQLKDQRSKLEGTQEKGLPKAMAVAEGKVADAKVNLRGDPSDLGESVPRGFLTAIGAPPQSVEFTSQSGRLELAQWMTSPEHPLTARVLVNRLWHWHFGEGLVTTTDNFGTTGDAPTNPALLDFLTRQFIADGWSMKKMHRRIMLSSSYRMSTAPGGRALRRMEAEAFRDAVLAVSGQLNPAPPTGAPPAVKAQDPSPADLAKNRKVYEEYPHRSIYLPVVRSHVYDLFTLLDFPNSTTPVGRRDHTTVATQALLMLNNPFLMEKAAQISKLVRTHQDPLNELHLRLFAQPADDDQRRWAEEFLQKSGGKDAAWAVLCHTLLISNDFLYLR